MKIIPCIHCGGDVRLPGTSNTQRAYCSTACMTEARQMKKQQQPIAEKPTQHCTICEAVFTPWRNGQKTCGDQYCKSEQEKRSKATQRGYTHEPLHPRPCAACGNHFQPKQRNHYTCSTECGDVISKRKASERWYSKHGEHERVCLPCNKMFKTRQPNQLYCSEACRTTARNDRYKKKLDPKPCTVCQTIFNPLSRHQHLCSEPCRIEYKQDMDRGRYRSNPREYQWEKDIDNAILKGTKFTKKETENAQRLGHFLTLSSEWHRKHQETIEDCAVSIPPPTPRELHSAGVNLHQQIRQWLGIRKSGEEDFFARLGTRMR